MVEGWRFSLALTCSALLFNQMKTTTTATTISLGATTHHTGQQRHHFFDWLTRRPPWRPILFEILWSHDGKRPSFVSFYPFPQKRLGYDLQQKFQNLFSYACSESLRLRAHFPCELSDIPKIHEIAPARLKLMQAFLRSNYRLNKNLVRSKYFTD